jgi:hypothetical protein
MPPSVIVHSPPRRSDSQPQNWRDRKAASSSTDSIAAPRDVAIPRSPQKATRCAAGIAIGTHFIALAKKDSGDSFYTAKLHTARFYFAKLLPETAGLIRTARAGAKPLMEMDEALF